MKHYTRGNILFLILLAVVLFAALAYAVTSSMRGGGNNASSEQNKALAATIINYFALVENTVNRMLLMGVKIDQLDFRANATDFAAGAFNVNCGTDDCRVFKQITPVPAPRAASLQNATYASDIWTPEWQGRFHALYISVKNVGTDLPDILFHYKGLSAEVCDQINIMSGVYAPGEGPISFSETLGSENTGFSNVSGAPPTNLTVNQFGNVDARIAGRQTFCIRRSAQSGYYAYHVLVAR